MNDTKQGTKSHNTPPTCANCGGDTDPRPLDSNGNCVACAYDESHVGNVLHAWPFAGACNSHDALVEILGELLPDLNWGTVSRWKAGTPDNARLLAALKAAKAEV